jgi:hypothetical protein
MMNIVQTQDQLKNFSQEQLIKEMQMPSGTAPQFLILNEIMRRQKMQQDFAAQQSGAPQTTVAEDAIAAAGVPQEGLAGMAQALAPQTDMMQNTGVGAVQQMYAGGPVKKMAEGDVVVRDGLQYVEGPDGTLRLKESERGARDNRPLTPDEQAMFAFGVPASELSSLGQEQPGMTTREEALALARAKPRGSGGAIDALLAAGAPDGMRANPAQFLPRREDMVAPERALDPMDAFQPDFGESTGPGFAFDLRIPRGESPSVEPMSGIIEAGRNAEGIDLSGLGPDNQAMSDFQEDFGVGDMGPNPSILDRMGLGPAIEKIRQNRPAAPEQDMTELARQSAEDAAKLREAAGITESLKEPTKPAEPASQGGGAGAGGAGAGGAGSGGAGGAGGMSSFEQELMSALDRREKAAEQDKWLALAQVGLNMMSSTQPTLLGAVGEAGLKGVEAARSARDTYDKDKLEILGAIEQSRMARAAAAASAARGAQGAAAKPINPAIIKLLEEKRTAAANALQMLPPPDPGGWFSGPTDPAAAERTRLDQELRYLDNALTQAYSTYGLGGVEASGEGLDFNATQ